jgi:hypothetical protein
MKNRKRGKGDYVERDLIDLRKDSVGGSYEEKRTVTYRARRSRGKMEME